LTQLISEDLSIVIMAPSVQELPQVIPTVNPEKLAAVVKETPKVKRQIEIEGGKTDASVCPPSFPSLPSSY
jgi:hypothetical protein